MKTYKKYKPSGVEWIGDIPEHWYIKKLKFLASVNPSSVDKKSVDGQTEVLLCNYTDVYKNEFIVAGMDFMKATATDDQIERFKLERGDILLTKDSEDPDDIAVPALVKDDLKGVVCGYHLTHVKPNPEILLGGYLFRLFQSDIFNKQFVVQANGVTRYGLPVAAFTEAFVCVPPNSEQHTIAAYLDQKTALIDDTIAKKQKLIELLHEERTALINKVVTRGLDDSAPTKPSGIEWLGEIPAHWEVRKLSRSFEQISSGTTPPAGNEKYYQEGTINWINTGDLNDGVLKSCSKRVTGEALKDFTTLKVYPRGSVVIALYGATIGKLSILDIEGCTNQACCVLTKSSFFNNEYLFFLLLSIRQHIISLASGGGQPNISQELVRSLKLPCPKIDEQIKIVDFLKERTSQIFDSIEKVNQEITLLSEYRTALINEVVTGKVCVL